MNRDTDVVTTKLLSDIKSLRDSFNKPTSDEQKSVTEMSNKISTGIYLVTQHLSDNTSIKMSLRNVANDLINVVYDSRSELYEIAQDILNMSDKILSFINFARISGSVSEVNSYLIEREVIKLERYISLVIARDDITQLQFSSKDRADTRMKLFELFDSETTDDIKKINLKVIDKGQQATFLKTKNKSKKGTTKITAEVDTQITESEYKGHTSTPHPIEINNREYNLKDTSASIHNTDRLETSPDQKDTSSSAHDKQTEYIQREAVMHNVISQGQSITPNTASKTHQPFAQSKSSVGSPIQERKDHVLQVIKLNGIVSIKEIAENISDVSEKTLQRTLIDLVNEGLIIRHGDRRWSRYEAVL